MPELRKHSLERLGVGQCRTGFAEENLAHVVIQPDHFPAQLAQQMHHTLVDQTTGARDGTLFEVSYTLR